MQRFIHRENIKHFKQLLEHTADQKERARILKLMAEEEEATDREPPAKAS